MLLKKIKQQIKKINKKINIERYRYMIKFRFKMDFSVSQFFFYSPTKQPKVEEKTYFLFGVLCGLALYNHNIIHLRFPQALFKKLLRVKPTLDDMKEFDPVLAE